MDNLKKILESIDEAICEITDEMAIQSLEEKLRLFGMVNYDKQPSNIQGHFIKIEKAIQIFNGRRKIALSIYKNHKINKSRIAEEAKIARQTLYNYGNILQPYILENCKLQEKEDMLSEIEKLKITIATLEKRISKLIRVDFENEKLKNDIINLRESLRNATHENTNLEIRNSRLIAENNELHEKLNKALDKPHRKLISLK